MENISEPNSLRVFTSSKEGHRRSYLEFIKILFDDVQSIEVKELLKTRNPVLFLMIEDNFLLYAAVAAFRSMLGRRTVGLLFRPRPAVEKNSLRLMIKWMVLKVLKQLTPVSTLTIVPHYTNKKFSRISDGWIYDFQFWDLGTANFASMANKADDLECKIRLEAKGRFIVVAVGTQNYAKGFQDFSNLYRDENFRKNFFFAYGGSVVASLSADADFISEFGYGINRYITDSEISSLYAAGDAVWCFYSENYDQASGITGRATQLGVPAILREGSLMHTICKVEGLAHIAIAKPQDLELLSFEKIESSDISSNQVRMRDISIRNLTCAIWGMQ